MKPVRKYLLILSVAISTLISCTRDSDAKVIGKTGEIKAVVTLTNSETWNIRHSSAASDTTGEIKLQIESTYLNTGEEYTVGPKITEQNKNEHSFVTNGNANNLTSITNITAITTSEDQNLSITVDIYLDDNFVDSWDSKIRGSIIIHHWIWNTENGFTTSRLETTP